MIGAVEVPVLAWVIGLCLSKVIASMSIGKQLEAINDSWQGKVI